MRQTFVVVMVVAGLLLWVVAVVYAEPAKCRRAVLQVPTFQALARDRPAALSPRPPLCPRPPVEAAAER